MNPAQATFEAGKLREQEERQAEFNKVMEAGRIPFLEHQREVEGKAEEARRAASADLDERIVAAITARGVSFEAPTVPGEGWASSELRRIVGSAAAEARNHLTTLVHAERELAMAKRALGTTIASPLLARPVAQLADLRVEIDIHEARFEYVYDVLQQHRARLLDAAFIASIVELNACAQAALFTPYVTDKDSEMAEIGAAVRAMLDAFASIARRQSAKLQEQSRATVLTRELGFTREHIGEENLRMVALWHGQIDAQRAAKAAADAWKRENGQFDVSSWIPNFDSPW